MHASENLTAAGRRWRTAADALLTEAEHLGPLEVGVFGELGTDDETEAGAHRVDEYVDTLLHEGDLVFAELAGPAASSSDTRFQATSLLVGTLAIGDALSMADPSPTSVFGELGVEAAQRPGFEAVRSAVAQADAIITVPASLDECLDEIESSGAAETWSLVTGTAGKLAGGALVAGLDGVLSGAAAAAFDTVVGQLSRWRDALKRGVVRIAAWVVEKMKSLLPDALADKVDALVATVQERLEAGAGDLGGQLYGRLLGRSRAEEAWAQAAANGADLGEAEGALAGVTSSHTGRVAWVTKGRQLIDNYDAVVAGALAAAGPSVKLGYAALVAAVLGFVALQVWDGFGDIADLV